VPTINLLLDEVPVGLEFGVYACRAKVLEKSYNGALHYGHRSSLDNLITFEVNLFDFDQLVYGEEVEVEVLDKVREIVKFDSKQDLKAQILKDIVNVKKLLRL
jgi:FAD synthase